MVVLAWVILLMLKVSCVKANEYYGSQPAIRGIFWEVTLEFMSSMDFIH